MVEEERPDEVWVWRRDELKRLGYTQKQRTLLLERIEQHEVTLEEIRHLGDDLHVPVETAWWIVS